MDDLDATQIYDPNTDCKPSSHTHEMNTKQLDARYENIINREEIAWEQSYTLRKVLGTGGQGTVFLADRFGAYDVSFQLALKFYRPDGYDDLEMYRSEMARLAEVAMDVSKIQQDHILDVYNVIEFEGILVLAAEWVDGLDLRQLTSPDFLKTVQRTVSADRWEYINDVVMTNAGFQSRMMPSMVLGIMRECLAGLSALHRQNIIHADMKPANVMVKQTGNTKIIDLGSSFNQSVPPRRPTWTWRYAPVEVLKGEPHTFLSDMASMGYVVLELLSGKVPFVGATDREELIQLKVEMADQVGEILPVDVARNTTLVEMISRMIAPKPEDRFVSLEDVDLADSGAAAIERQLVKVDMDTDVATEFRVLLSEYQAASRL